MRIIIIFEAQKFAHQILIRSSLRRQAQSKNISDNLAQYLQKNDCIDFFLHFSVFVTTYHSALNQNISLISVVTYAKKQPPLYKTRPP
jgi:hypothetical protein